MLTDKPGIDFLDVSWSSLQSLASSVLGSDITRPSSNAGSRTHSRKPSRPDPYMHTPKSTPSAWGPSAPSTPEIGAGTKEDRQAYVQAKKREALLLADTGPSMGNSRTRHKRRDSSDYTTHTGIDSEQDEEALAYIHHVQPTDTMTSLTIKYGCQPAIFRKANGFWPSDSIQSRKTVLLPVDSCSVKGRPIRSAAASAATAANIDLLNESSEDMGGSSIVPVVAEQTQSQTSTKEDEKQPPAEAEADRIWKPESWVQIDNFPEPVEIGRVPRRALGFFPRTRRKSISYSDVEPTASSSSPPTSSLPTPDAFQIEPEDHDPEPEPPQPPKPPGSGSGSGKGSTHRRQRSNLHLGGRGVGTLDRGTKAPGPALDGLSKFVSQHLPNLAPASASASATSTPPDGSGGSRSMATAQANTTTSLDNLGGAFEGWVRKMTTRAKASFNELQQAGAAGAGGSGSGMGGSTYQTNNLIELDDGLGLGRSLDARSVDDDRVGSTARSTPGTSRSRAGNRTKDD